MAKVHAEEEGRTSEVHAAKIRAAEVRTAERCNGELRVAEIRVGDIRVGVVLATARARALSGMTLLLAHPVQCSRDPAC